MFTIYDIIIVPICIFLLWLIAKWRFKKYEQSSSKLFLKAFKFKIFCAVAFALITAYYYGGGDSEMFFYAVKDMRQAIANDDLSFWELFKMEKTDKDSPLAYYFELDDVKYPLAGYMKKSSNFLVPKLALLPAVIFFNSYLCICLVFSFFALGGAIRLYKMFLHYFPGMRVEVALSTLFLPSVCYWSSGFLKDSICFGSVGFLLYGLFSVFVRQKKIAASLFWIVLSSYFLYSIKVYILLALVPGIAFWLFGHLGREIKTLALKRAVTFLSLIIAGIAGMALVNYLTSDEALSRFSLDNILETSSYSRDIYETSSEKRGKGAYFQIATTNPVLLILNGLVATFFRPFPWEISSAIVMLSAMEALIFLVLILYLFVKRGLFTPFRLIFNNPVLILCFLFAIIFAIAIGASATNFGSLSRYKIPCLPFYLMFILAVYHMTALAYPKWLQKILTVISKK